MDLQSGNVFLLQQPVVGTFQQALQGLYASNTSAPGAAARPVQFLDSTQFYAGAVAGVGYQTLAPPPVTSPATSGWAPAAAPLLMHVVDDRAAASQSV